jgi:hypothetical protein
MRESLPGKLLVALLQASPEQMAAIEHILFGAEVQRALAITELPPSTPSEPEEPSDRGSGIAAKVFELLDALDSARRLRKAPLLKVFNFHYRQGLDPSEIARMCGCHRSLVFARLETLRKQLPWKPHQLCEVSPHVEALEDAVRESRASHIYRKAAIEGDEESDEP